MTEGEDLARVGVASQEVFDGVRDTTLIKLAAVFVASAFIIGVCLDSHRSTNSRGLEDIASMSCAGSELLLKYRNKPLTAIEYQSLYERLHVMAVSGQECDK